MKFTCSLLLGVGLAVFAAIGTAHAVVSELTVAGSTKGAFDGAGFSSNTSLLGLTYNSSSFAGTTSAGGFSFGGGGANDLGKFTLSGAPATYTGHTFDLQVVFSLPTGISGGGSTSVSALFLGSVSAPGNGFLHIDFDNTPRVFSFNNGKQSGSFSLFVNDLDVNPGLTNSVNGLLFANVSAIPEVSSFLPLGFVLLMAGMAEGFRRRRSSCTA